MSENTERNTEDRITEEKIDQILENQEALLKAAYYMFSPTVAKGSNLADKAHTNNCLLDCYNRTRMLLGKDYVKRW